MSLVKTTPLFIMSPSIGCTSISSSSVVSYDAYTSRRAFSTSALSAFTNSFDSYLPAAEDNIVSSLLQEERTANSVVPTSFNIFCI